MKVDVEYRDMYICCWTNDSANTFPRQRIRRQQSDKFRCYAVRYKSDNRGRSVFCMIRMLSIAGQRMCFLCVRLETT
jgi:hypothetical protein